ncbi:hypothetical protein HNR46_001085 [Haloferula luteola]|uniref:Uncharacterized protein n=1 Tax=Haloferula luteola TaxID=595692 RepID=A0A840VDC8_9BACT|nr:hypothetical protein [Haloferula luteola]MBB5350851.1 hypothetical protein [Haloferula luteola]
MKTQILCATALLSGWGGLLEARDFQIRALSVFQGYPSSGEVYVHEAGGSGTAVKLKRYLNHESQLLELKGNHVIFTTEASAESIGDETKKLGELDLPAKLARGIVFFSPADGDEPAAAHLVDDSAKGFPAGTFKVINLSSLEVKIELEQKPFPCAPQKETLIAKAPVNDRNASGMRAFYEDEAAPQGWKQFAASMWPNPGKKRGLQIILPAQGGQAVTLRGFNDVVEVK